MAEGSTLHPAKPKKKEKKKKKKQRKRETFSSSSAINAQYLKLYVQVSY